MTNAPSDTYLAITSVASVLTVAGVWLPWVQKLPVGAINGQPVYTDEWVTGMGTGIQGIDIPLILLAVTVLGVAVLARQRQYHPDLALVIVGAVMLWGTSTIGYDYWMVDRYAIGTGLYLLFASGLLFTSLGLGTLLKRRFTPDTAVDTHSSSE